MRVDFKKNYKKTYMGRQFKILIKTIFITCIVIGVEFSLSCLKSVNPPQDDVIRVPHVRRVELQIVEDGPNRVLPLTHIADPFVFIFTRVIITHAIDPLGFIVTSAAVLAIFSNSAGGFIGGIGVELALTRGYDSDGYP